jgi:hypothetical protein
MGPDCGGLSIVADDDVADGAQPVGDMLPGNPDGRARPSRRLRIAALVFGALTIVIAVGLLVAPPDADPRVAPPSRQQSTATLERGDPVLAQHLADQATGTDVSSRIRLLLAAHVAAPDRALYRVGLAQLLLAGVTPTRVIEASVAGGGPITVAAINSDGSFLITGTSSGARVWQTARLAGPQQVRLAAGLGGPVLAASGAGSLTRTHFLTIGADHAASAWSALSPDTVTSLGQLAPQAEAVAVAPDDDTVVTVTNGVASFWDLRGVGLPPHADIALPPYAKPVTVLAFAPGGGLVLAAGHGDGSVTVDTVDLDQQQAKQRDLTAAGGRVDAVAISADASTMAALDVDGSLSVWDLRPQGAAVAEASRTAAAGSGAHRVWLGPTGDYAVISDTTGPPALWSLADPEHPSRIGDLPIGSDPAVPAMIGADGRTAVTIDAHARMTVWDLRPILGLLDDPTARACQIAAPDVEQWRQMLGNTPYPNPCTQPGLPTLSVTNG